MTITTEYPVWLIIFCLASGALCSAILYRKNPDFPLWTKILLAFSRFSVISFLAFFLLNPLLKTIFKEIEKPVIVIAQDNSRSLVTGKDSAFYQGEYRPKLEELISSLESEYEVKTFSFGEKVTENIPWDFREKQTDISQMLDEIHTRYSNRNVGAVILASDGIYNKGANPVFSSSKIKFPLYAIALGDTSATRDLVLKKVMYNRIAYLGNRFPLEILIEARELEGKTTQLRISRGKETVFSKAIEIAGNPFHLSVPVQLDADQKGIQRYTVRLSTMEEETNFSNNVFDVYIDVLDGRQKIVMLVNSPHPDIRALRETIESSDNYETDVFYVKNFRASDIKKYNLAILHQVPSVKNPAGNLLQSISQEKIPVLFILGGETDWNGFNNQQTGVIISGARGKTTESQPLLNKNFALFTLGEEARNYFRYFPPLQTPFGNYKLTPSANVLFYQKVGMVETGQPLVFFNSVSDKKNAVIAGEGLWRWRLNDFAQHKNHVIFNEFILKTVQYLALKENKNKFRITGKNNFLENEPVAFDAELYNESFELINEPEINVEIINEEEKKFPFVFSKTDNAYRLEAGVFPVGNYRYEARAKVADKILSATGEFSVSPIQVEAVTTVADHQLLFNLAEKHDGRMLFPGQLAEIPGLLESREDIASVSYTQKKLSDFINLKWIFFLLLALLSMEWLIRKRNGSY